MCFKIWLKRHEKTLAIIGDVFQAFLGTTMIFVVLTWALTGLEFLSFMVEYLPQSLPLQVGSSGLFFLGFYPIVMLCALFFGADIIYSTHVCKNFEHYLSNKIKKLTGEKIL